MRILLAEDDEHVAAIAKICLERLGGHFVARARDGLDAIAIAISGERFDLLLLDGAMPGANGLEVAKKLAGTPAIFLTASADRDELARFAAASLGVIAKPFEPRDLCAAIDRLMARAEGQAG